MQRNVGKLGDNLEIMTGWIHRAALVKSGRVWNLGSITYEKFDKQGRLNITIPKKGKEEKGGGGRGRVELSRWVTLWGGRGRQVVGGRIR